MTRTAWISVAAGGSAALLLAAFAFQYLGGLAPCPMCLWQRWPHAAAVAIGAVAIVFSDRRLAGLGLLAALTAALLALYHSGIERDWWEGPATCAGGSLAGLTGAELLDPLAAPPPVLCDEIVWSLMGLSMANWNGLLALALAGAWAMAATRTG